MPTVHEIEQALYELAPRDLAQSWDNVGLLVGEPDREVSRILVALDVTEQVAAEARDMGAGLIVAHHPVMNIHWHERELQTLRDDTRLGKLLMSLVKTGVSAICMHTNLDSAQGGVNDALAGALGLEEIECFSDDGIGRVGILPEAVELPAFLRRVKEGLRPNGIRYVDAGKAVHRVAVGGGACGDYFRRAVEMGCDTFVTADVKYDQFLDAKALGLNLIDAGHYPTEDVVCPVLIRWLEERFPSLTIVKSASHREVIQYYV